MKKPRLYFWWCELVDNFGNKIYGVGIRKNPISHTIGYDTGKTFDEAFINAMERARVNQFIMGN